MSKLLVVLGDHNNEEEEDGEEERLVDQVVFGRNKGIKK